MCHPVPLSQLVLFHDPRYKPVALEQRHKDINIVMPISVSVASRCANSDAFTSGNNPNQTFSDPIHCANKLSLLVRKSGQGQTESDTFLH